MSCDCICSIVFFCVLTLGGSLTARRRLVYLCPRRVACASPCGGSLYRTVWAFGWKPSAAVRVAEALAVLFADLREQTVFTYNVDFTYDLAKILKQAVFVLIISVCTAPSALHTAAQVRPSLLKLKISTLNEASHTVSTEDDSKLTFFCRRQWKMKINIPWKVFNMVKRYAMTIEASLIKKRPKDHVRPKRHSRAKAPMTQDLKDNKHTGRGRIQHERQRTTTVVSSKQ